MLNIVFICLIQDTANFLFNATVTYHAYRKDDQSNIMLFVTLRACARGSLSVCRRRHRRHENHQISCSRHLCVLQAQPIGR